MDVILNVSADAMTAQAVVRIAADSERVVGNAGQ